MTAQEIFGRLESSQHFAALVESVEQSIGPGVQEYVAGLEGTPPYVEAKAFKDAVWGMIDLQGREVLLLDSPPLQRLRRVRQLGLGFLTYPTAGYSRFEHTIGAVHQSERMLRAIARRSDGETETRLNDALNTVRLAAMLHDLGHLPLSHVSERFYTLAECADQELLRPVEDVLNEIALVLPASLKLAEALTLAVISSPSFKALLTDKAGYSEEQVATAALAISGRPPSITDAFIAQLVSNVVDADKLDYMFRDAFVTRVPLAVDLERLLFKLECLEVKYQDLPTDDLRQLAAVGQKGLVLGTDLAGDRLSYDLAISRSMLFERVYFHHKTRAAERVALAALRDLGLPPTELLLYDDNIFAQYGSALHPEKLKAPAEMLLNRRLPRRAMALSYQFFLESAPSDQHGNVAVDEEKTDSWERLIDDLNDASSRLEFEREVRAQAEEFAELLGPPIEIRVDIDTVPESPRIDDSELLVRLPDGGMISNSVLPAKFAAFTYDPLAIAHVFVTGPRKAEQYVFIAAEIVLDKRYGLHFGKASANYAKLSWREIENVKRDLEAEQPDLYSKRGHLRPSTALRESAAADERVKVLADRFAHYNAMEGSDENVDQERIFSYLDQFPPELAEPMLNLLEKVQFLDRQALGKRFAAGIAEGASDDLVSTPLTDRSGKSAEHLGYYLSDGNLRLEGFEKALESDAPLAFYDDLTISGKQARTVVQTWAGLEPDLNESLADRLPAEQMKRLRERGVRFRFAYARPSGIEALKEITEAAELGDDVGAMIVDEQEDPLAEEGEELTAFLADVGERLLLSTKHLEDPQKWTKDLCAERALGYSNAKRLVVLAYNTPTSTITALWKSGTYRGAPWMPLFPRRGEALSSEEAASEGVPLIEE
jgi:HD superfamily phosphohydrolase